MEAFERVVLRTFALSMVVFSSIWLPLHRRDIGRIAWVSRSICDGDHGSRLPKIRWFQNSLIAGGAIVSHRTSLPEGDCKGLVAKRGFLYVQRTALLCRLSSRMPMSPAHPVNDVGPDLPMGTPANQRPYVLQPDTDFRNVGKHGWTAQGLQSGRGGNQAACMVHDRGDGYFGKRV